MLNASQVKYSHRVLGFPGVQGPQEYPGLKILHCKDQGARWPGGLAMSEVWHGYPQPRSRVGSKPLIHSHSHSHPSLLLETRKLRTTFLRVPCS